MKKRGTITLKSAFEGLLLTWAEWHCMVIGWGDGVSFSRTDWKWMNVYYPREGMRSELHYYKFGSALGRLTWAGVITAILAKFVG